MGKMTQAYFTTGEFAKICSTTKETLFHYDKIGLLEPQFIGENHYRYYTVKQFYMFDLIDTLKMAGCSLSEIKEYISNYDPHKYLELLERCFDKLEQRRREIEKMQKILDNSRDSVKAALKGAEEKESEVPGLEQCEEEYFIITPFENGDELGEVMSLHDHFTYCADHALGDEFTIGSIIQKSEIEAGTYVDRHYYSKITELVDADRLYVKPAGTYLVMLHRGNYETIPRTCERLTRYMKQQGYKLNGDGYIYDIISYFASQKEADFVHKISLAVTV